MAREIDPLITASHEEITAIRRDFHANPEIGFQEFRTAQIVAERLKAYGVDEVHTGIGQTGLVGVIRGKANTSGASIGLRADMDALPMPEKNLFAHASKVQNMMHACGHDGHTAMLLGTAKYLAKTRKFDGTVYLIFQPAEEGWGGGDAMVKDGLFDRFPAQRIFALHNRPELAPGQFGLRDGPCMAATDSIKIHIVGKGGHAARPHLVIDPMVAAANIILAAQSIVARSVNPLDCAVLGLSAISGGNLPAFSVVPGEVTITGTGRSYKVEVQDILEYRLRTLVDHIAQAHGCTATVDYIRNYPSTINTTAEYQFAAEIADEVFGKDNVLRDHPPSMGGEDFSFMLLKKPGCYAWIGNGLRDGCSIHNSGYDFNDAIIPSGITWFSKLIERGMPLQS
jgi:amidohydrolase